MQFTDLVFLLVFLPTALVLFYIADDKIKPYLLLCVSLFFYSMSQSDFLLALCILTIFNTGVAMCVERMVNKNIRLPLLIIGIGLNIAILAFYKYDENVLLPLGLSFYSFKAVSVLADSYTGKAFIKHPIDVANYLSFFGQIQSGPISKYVVEGNYEVVGGHPKLFIGGIERFMVGFSKKVLLSNILVKIIEEVFEYENPSFPLAWLGAICFSLQLYYDFSGYSDMAIGISNMFGIPCEENFNYPYITASISEFWRRWHISLGQWFRDYVYIPLGGSRVKLWRIIFNLGIVWVLTAIWHGITGGFLLWGLAYFMLIAFEKLTGYPQKFKNSICRFLYRIYSLVMINLLWVVFYFGHVTPAVRFIRNMFTLSGYDISIDRAKFLLTDYRAFIVAAILFATPIVPVVMKVCQKKKWTEIIYNVIYGTAVVVLFIVSLAMVVSGESNPFLYIGF